MKILFWAPLVALALLSFALLAFFLRNSKRSCSYSLQKRLGKQWQPFVCIFFRAFLSALCLDVPLLTASSLPNGSTAYKNCEIIARLLHGFGVCVCQPAIYYVVCSSFAGGVSIFFRRYSHNTKRQWQSASDPPKARGVNEVCSGSWYSSAGNIIGEAGLPIESSREERKVCYYKKY